MWPLFFSEFFCVTHNELSERGTNQPKVTSMYHIKIKKFIVATFAQGRGTKKKQNFQHVHTRSDSTRYLTKLKLLTSNTLSQIAKTNKRRQWNCLTNSILQFCTSYVIGKITHSLMERKSKQKNKKLLNMLFSYPDHK